MREIGKEKDRDGSRIIVASWSWRRVHAFSCPKSAPIVSLNTHHWQQSFKPQSAALIVLSAVVDKDANYRFQSSEWKKRQQKGGGHREAFSSLETLACVQRSLSSSIEVWAQRTATQRPAILFRQQLRAVSQGWWTCRLSIYAWSIAPGSICFTVHSVILFQNFVWL